MILGKRELGRREHTDRGRLGERIVHYRKNYNTLYIYMKLLSKSNKNKVLEQSYILLFHFYVENWKEFSRKKKRSIFNILCIVKNFYLFFIF